MNLNPERPLPDGTITERCMTRLSLKDFALFYLAIPLALAAVFSVFGMRLIVGMPFLDGFAYMIIHFCAAWWGIDIGCRITHRLCRSWRPPVHVIMVLGFFLMMVPLTFFYKWLGEVYAGMYPSFAEVRKATVLPSWSLAYLLHFLRFSVTALPIFMLGVYGVQRLAGIRLYQYERSGEAVPPSAGPPAAEPPEPLVKQARAKLFSDSKLPAEAVLFAVKADEHYIHLWTDQGEDLIRCRFRDALALLEPFTGIRTHRSWWVNPACVVSSVRKGRSLELELANELTVPVSLAHKEAVSTQLQSV